MINTIAIKNFKSLYEISTKLERFTVFVGPNASGKSSILQAVDALCVAFQSFPQEGTTDDRLLRAKARGETGLVELVAACNGRWYRSRPWAQQSGARHPGVNVRTKTGAQGRAVASSVESEEWQTWKPAEAPPLPRTVLLRLETTKLLLPQPAIHDSSIMSPDGSGLHSALAGMALNDPESWQQLQESLRGIIPIIRRLRHAKPQPNNPHYALQFDTVGAESLSADQVSEGTLLVLGLLAAFHAPERPNLMLLDDLDRGLHPGAQRELIKLLRRLLEKNPELQILATTHSPYMLDWLEPAEVRMTILRGNGATVCRSLTSHPDFEKWKEEMTPGEMWSLFGEKWMIDEGENK